MSVRADPRSLADDIRARSDQDLAVLLRARPDLVVPVPDDVTALVARATTRTSVLRALERLDRFALQTIDALACSPDPTTYQHLRGLVGADGQLPETLARLREQALVWGPDDALRLVRAVREIIGPAPADTGPPLCSALATLSPARLQHVLTDLGLPSTHDPVSAVDAITAVFTDPGRLEGLLAQAPAQAVAILDRLTWGPPTGRVEDAHRDVRASDARTPVEWLLARALLVPAGDGTVALPREIAIHLRGGRIHRRVEPEPPALETASHDPGLVDRAAAGSARAAVGHIEDILEYWAADTPPVLRTGGLGVRDMRRTARAVNLNERDVALYAETAYAMDLLAASDDDVDEVWLPTTAYDAWRSAPAKRRWTAMVSAWLTTTRVAALVGNRTERERLVAPLGPDLERTMAPEIRRAVLTELAALAPGCSASAASVVARLGWHRPLRAGQLRRDLDSWVTWTLREGELLGLTSHGALGSPARALLAGDPVRAADALEALLPEPLDHVLVQADLTVVAPGPLTAHLSRELGLAATVESTGGATVYRFTDASIRHALDAGRTAADLHALLERHSRTPVPQPLSYLVDDVARRHGRVRVGTASAYVRCDDEAVLTELLAERRAAQLRLRRLAAT
ncbi:MAG: helicase-associated domain-containing protein, partial [Carbonactinosporaceae bacterium]